MQAISANTLNYPVQPGTRYAFAANCSAGPALLSLYFVSGTTVAPYKLADGTTTADMVLDESDVVTLEIVAPTETLRIVESDAGTVEFALTPIQD